MTEAQIILSDDIFFCEIMADHYAERYRKLCCSWKFAGAVLSWKRMKAYQRRITELKKCERILISVFNEVNQTPLPDIKFSR